MDNSNETPTIGGMPNPNQNQPLNQPVNQPVFQQTPQPIQNQPIIQPIPNIPNGNNQKSKKKIGIIVGCSVGVVAVIAVVAFLLITLLKHREKTVACTMSTTTMGITINGETNVKVRDGEISGGDITINVDLKTLQNSYKNYEKEMVDKMTKQYKNRCEDHCTFDYNYVEGDNVKYTMQYDKEGVDEIVWSYGTENMSAQEIADKVQKTLEDSDTTCVQR